MWSTGGEAAGAGGETRRGGGEDCLAKRQLKTGEARSHWQMGARKRSAMTANEKPSK